MYEGVTRTPRLPEEVINTTQAISLEGMLVTPVAATPPQSKFVERFKSRWKDSKDYFDNSDIELEELNKMFDEDYPFIQPYLMNAHKKVKFTNDNLKFIYDNNQFIQIYYGIPLGKEKKPEDVGAITDKKNGIIYLNASRPGHKYATIETVIHEGIHLLAHPPGAIITYKHLKEYAYLNNTGCFKRFYGDRLDEGVNHYFTEFILHYKGFKNWYTSAYVFEKEPVYSLIGWLGPQADQIMAEAYFTYDYHRLLHAMWKIWGTDVANVWLDKLSKKKKSEYKEAFKILQEPWRAYE